MKHLHRTKIAVLVVGCTLIATTGLAYAGALPGAAQSVASSMLAKLGVMVPGPNAHAGTHPDSRGQPLLPDPVPARRRTRAPG